MDDRDYTPQYFIMVTGLDVYGTAAFDHNYSEDKKATQDKVDELNRTFRILGLDFQAILRTL